MTMEAHLSQGTVLQHFRPLTLPWDLPIPLNDRDWHIRERT